MSETGTLDEHTVARRLGVGIDTFRKLVEDGEFPPGIYVSDRIKVWLPMDVEAYLHLKSRLPPRKASGKPPKGAVGLEGD